MKTCYIVYNPLPPFSVFSQLHSPTSTIFVALLLSVNVWSYHIWYVILLNDMTDKHLLSLDILVPFMQQVIKCVVGLTQMTWFLLALWFDITHTQTNNIQYIKGPRDWHINIYYHHLSCAHSSYLYHIELISHWYQKFIQQSSAISFFSKNSSLAEVTSWLIRFIKTKFFVWNTKNTNKNGVNEQNPYAHVHRERWH